MFLVVLLILVAWIALAALVVGVLHIATGSATPTPRPRLKVVSGGADRQKATTSRRAA